MKKILFLLSAIAILASSCAEKDAFTITGKLPSGEYDGQQVYLKTLGENLNDRELVGIDTVNVVQGQFVFKGLAKEGPMLHFIVLDDAPEGWQMPIAVVIEPGSIEVTVDSISSVKGTSINNDMQAYNDKAKALMDDMYSLYKKSNDSTLTKEEKQDLRSQMETIYEQLKDERYKITQANVGNEIGAYIFSSYYNEYSLEHQKEILSGMDEKYKSTERMQKIESRVIAQEATAVGKTFADIKGKTPGGKDVALSDYAGKGKYVLVDFWADWCGPCRAEMPKVVELYKQYKDKGLEVVGVSFDNEQAAWERGIKQLNITWPQISDLKGWESAGAITYGINYIPQMMIIDRDGKIIERGIGADEATEKLAELLD